MRQTLFSFVWGFDCCTFNYIISLRPLLLQRSNGHWLENWHHQRLIFTVDGNADSSALSVADFLEILWRFSLNLDGNLTLVPSRIKHDCINILTFVWKVKLDTGRFFATGFILERLFSVAIEIPDDQRGKLLHLRLAVLTHLQRR